jgi:hypothetical protein
MIILPIDYPLDTIIILIPLLLSASLSVFIKDGGLVGMRTRSHEVLIFLLHTSTLLTSEDMSFVRLSNITICNTMPIT